jgi:MFS family permease
MDTFITWSPGHQFFPIFKGPVLQHMAYLPVSSRTRQLGIIFSASIAGFMVMLDSYIVNISLPFIARSFHVGTSLVVLVSLVYLVVLCGTIILFGKMADQYGVRRIFLAGFGIFAPINSLGVLVGSPLGGLITGLLSWNWVFLVNVPIGIAAIVFALRQVPADPVPGRKRENPRFDYLGSLLSVAGLGVLVFILNQGRRLGYGSPAFLFGLAFSAAALTAFILREKRVKEPLLDLSIFRDRNFSLSLFVSAAGMALLAGNGVLLPFYLIYILHIRVEAAGLIMIITPVIFSLLSLVIGPFSDRFSRARLMSAGMVAGLLTSGAFSFLIPLTSLFIVVACSVALGLSYAFFITPNNNLVMSLAPRGKQSVSSSVYRLSTNLGQIIGILGMELAFTLSFPPHVHPAGHLLKSLSTATLTEGFQYSYAAGGLLCLVALLGSLFIRDTGRNTAPVEAVAAG